MFDITGLVKLGDVRRRKCLARDFIPVDAFEPGVAHDVFGVSFTAAKSLVGVLLQQLVADVSGIG